MSDAVHPVFEKEPGHHGYAWLRCRHCAIVGHHEYADGKIPAALALWPVSCPNCGYSVAEIDG